MPFSRALFLYGDPIVIPREERDFEQLWKDEVRRMKDE